MFEKLSSHVHFKFSKTSWRGTHIFQHDRLIYFRQIGSPSHRRKTRKFPLCYCHPQWANHLCLCDCTPKVCAVHLGRELNFKTQIWIGLCQKFWNIVAAHHSVIAGLGSKRLKNNSLQFLNLDRTNQACCFTTELGVYQLCLSWQHNGKASKRRNPRSLVGNNFSVNKTMHQPKMCFFGNPTFWPHDSSSTPRGRWVPSLAPPITDWWIALADRQALQHHLGRS